MGTHRLILNIDPAYSTDTDIGQNAANSPTPDFNTHTKNVRGEEEKTIMREKFARQRYGVML